MMLNVIFTVLIWLAIAVFFAGIGTAIYALTLKKDDDPWGWGEIVEQLRKEQPGKGW
jgi:hypothetical protein